MGTPGVTLAAKVESVLSADLITEITTADRVVLAKEFTGMYWSAVADPFACSDEDDEDMLGQSLVSQAIKGAFALVAVYDGSNSQVALGDANVCVDVVVTQKEYTGNTRYNETPYRVRCLLDAMAKNRADPTIDRGNKRI